MWGGAPHTELFSSSAGGEKIVFHGLSIVNEKCNEITQVPQILALLRLIDGEMRACLMRRESEYNTRNLRLKTVFRRFPEWSLPDFEGI
jgi:hypothetical protein